MCLGGDGCFGGDGVDRGESWARDGERERPREDVVRVIGLVAPRVCCLAASTTLFRRFSAAADATLVFANRFAAASSALKASAFTGRVLGLTMVSRG